jgi:carbamoyltransferase
MNVVGISAFYHDSACCVLQDGRLVAAAQEERFSRIKGDARLPWRAFRYCLSEAGLHPGEVDVLAFYEDPAGRWSRQAAWGHPRHPALDPREMVRRRLGYHGPVRTFDHHASHAASAFLFSPHDGAAVLTADGVGEWATTTYAVGEGPRLEMLEEVRFPHSIGLFYGALTRWLGFPVNGGEGTVMALAALGRPRLAGILGGLLRDGTGGSFELDTELFPFDHTMASPELESVLGIPPRRAGEPLTEDHADLAASLQDVVERLVLDKVAYLRATTGAHSLCLAGGVALNCVLNGRIAREAGFSEVFIQPAPGDAGGALGAAALAHVEATGRRPQPLSHPFLGPSFDPEIYLAGTAVPYHRHESEEALLVEAVGRLEAGQVIGWYQGRMEFGPRALGARSLLADPRSSALRDRINARIKGRESFRPFGISVLQEGAEQCLDGPVQAPWMQLTCGVAPELGAVRHVDGTTRPQLVSPKTEPRFSRLLKAWSDRTGCPGLLNTSLNTRGEPLVCSPVDAVFTLAEGGFDALFMDCYRVEALPAEWTPLLGAWRGPGHRAGRADLYSF